MKCVRLIGQGVPYRMSDEAAFQIVEREFDGEYCSKSFWKNWYEVNPYNERGYLKGHKPNEKSQAKH